MARVIVARQAYKDLIAIRGEPPNPDEARQAVQALRQSIEQLAETPERGKPLDAVLPARTDIRFLACRQYRVFYLYGDDTVKILRVLHGLQDFMRTLFA